MRLLDNRRCRIVACAAAVLVLCASADAATAIEAGPDNAALVYYQACLYYSRLDEPYEDFNLFSHEGNSPSEAVRDFFKDPKCQQVLGLVDAATQIPGCDWGLLPAYASIPVIPAYRGLRDLNRLLLTHTKLSAVDGRYDEALDGIRRLRRFSCHLGDDIFTLFTLSLAADGGAFVAARNLLNTMPPDVDMLAQLESELADDKGPPWHPKETLTAWRDLEIRRLQALPDEYASQRDWLLSQIEVDARRVEMRDMKEGQLLERASETYEKVFLDTVLEILASDQTRQVKHLKIVNTISEGKLVVLAGEPIGILWRVIEWVEPYYRLHVNHLAYVHAVRAAIAIYRIKATTGQLPEELPEGLPKDPYSDQDFLYQITDEGFYLRCRVITEDWNEPRQFDFRVRE